MIPNYATLVGVERQETGRRVCVVMSERASDGAFILLPLELANKTLQGVFGSIIFMDGTWIQGIWLDG